MPKMTTYMTVYYENAAYAKVALERARKKFLKSLPASMDKSRQEGNVVYFPRGVAHCSDGEVSYFLRNECKGYLPEGIKV